MSKGKNFGCGTLILLCFVLWLAYSALKNHTSEPATAAPQESRQKGEITQTTPKPPPTPEPSPEGQFWPQTVTLKSPLALHSKDGTRSLTLASGREIQIYEARDGILTVRMGDIQGNIAASATDFWDRAKRNRKSALEQRARDEKQRLARQEAAQQAEADEQASYGNEPLFGNSGFGGVMVPNAMKRAITSSLRDPDSFKPREAISMKRAIYDGQKCYQLVLIFSARNGFGGMAEARATAYMRGSELLAIAVEKTE